MSWQHVQSASFICFKNSSRYLYHKFLLAAAIFKSTLRQQMFQHKEGASLNGGTKAYVFARQCIFGGRRMFTSGRVPLLKGVVNVCSHMHTAEVQKPK